MLMRTPRSPDAIRDWAKAKAESRIASGLRGWGSTPGVSYGDSCVAGLCKFFCERELHEGLLEIVFTGVGQQVVDRARSHGAPVRHHHHAVAQALHLLHDVRREHDALAAAFGRAQKAQSIAQRARG